MLPRKCAWCLKPSYKVKAGSRRGYLVCAANLQLQFCWGLSLPRRRTRQNLANGGGYETYSPFVSRIEPVIIYDFEPGVIVRCYWCPLWQNLHYFPRTGKRPKVGRREVLPTRRMQKPQEFYRYWSVSSVFAPQLSPTAAPSNSALFLSTTAQSTARNIQSQRGRIRHVQTFYFAWQIDA
jgi:hypothetical protein